MPKRTEKYLLKLGGIEVSTIAELKKKIRHKDKRIEQLESSNYSGKFRVLVAKNKNSYVLRIYTNSAKEAEILFDIMRKTYSDNSIYLSKLVRDPIVKIETFRDVKWYEKRWDQVAKKHVIDFHEVLEMRRA